MIEIETARLTLRRFTLEDAPFFRALVNDPDWIRNIGQRNIHTDADARAGLQKSYLDNYAENGFGLYLVALKDGSPAGTPAGTPIGMCGLIKRKTLDDVDIGFAFLPSGRGQGYAEEAARASLQYGKDVLGKSRVVAIVLPTNLPSVALLEKIGLRFEKMIRLTDDADDLAYYSINL
jgi:[ribosomal protein S5]-alanine N-acetyltransferase